MKEEGNYFTKRREPFRFMLQLGILGSILLFGLIFFIFYARNTKTAIPVPAIFDYSTAAIIVSSITLILANRCFYKENFAQYRITMSVTFILGIVFVLMQFWGWFELFNSNIKMNNNMGAAFLYILSGLHILHILIGIGVLSVTFKASIQNKKYIDSYIYAVNPPNILRLKLISYFWHFIDILWIVIYLFLIFHQ
jgi:cytochrome c oxidase subunit III